MHVGQGTAALEHSLGQLRHSVGQYHGTQTGAMGKGLFSANKIAVKLPQGQNGQALAAEERAITNAREMAVMTVSGAKAYLHQIGTKGKGASPYRLHRRGNIHTAKGSAAHEGAVADSGHPTAIGIKLRDGQGDGLLRDHRKPRNTAGVVGHGREGEEMKGGCAVGVCHDKYLPFATNVSPREKKRMTVNVGGEF